MTTTIVKLNQLMTTTQEEDTQYLNDVTQEIKVKRNQADPECIHQKRQKRESEHMTYDVITQTL